MEAAYLLIDIADLNFNRGSMLQLKTNGFLLSTYRLFQGILLGLSGLERTSTILLEKKISHLRIGKFMTKVQFRKKSSIWRSLRNWDSGTII